MKIRQFLKTLAKALMTVFVAQEAMAYDETLNHRMAYDIGCPHLPVERMDQMMFFPITSDFLESYGISNANDTGIIGNSEWTLIPHRYSSSENRTIIRNGGYYPYVGEGQSPYRMGSTCLFFADDAFDFGYMGDRIPSNTNPTSMECYYDFYKDESYVAREGIDRFALKTKLKAPISLPLDSKIVDQRFGSGYTQKTGVSAYDKDQFVCGGMHTIPFKKKAYTCALRGMSYDNCNIVSYAPSIPDGKLNITDQKETPVTPISKFFNSTQPCNCNCNCNCNVKVETLSKDEDYIQDENNTAVERNRKEDCKCKKDKPKTSNAVKASSCLVL